MEWKLPGFKCRIEGENVTINATKQYSFLMSSVTGISMSKTGIMGKLKISIGGSDTISIPVNASSKFEPVWNHLIRCLTSKKVVEPTEAEKEAIQKSIDSSKSLKVKIAVGAAVFVLFIIIIAASGGSSRPGKDELGVLHVDGNASQQILVAKDEQTFKELSDALTKKDSSLLSAVIMKGSVFSVGNGTKVKVLVAGAATYQVQIADGPLKSQQGFIAAEFVEKKK